MADKFEIRVYDWDKKLKAKYDASDEKRRDEIVRREMARTEVAAIFVQQGLGRNKKVYGASASKNPNKKK